MFKLTPWKSIITSKTCIALFVTHFSQSWGVLLFLTNAPTYIEEVLKFDIKSNGLLLSIPYASCLVVVILSGVVSDNLIKSYHWSPCVVRKLFTIFGTAHIYFLFEQKTD